MGAIYGLGGYWVFSGFYGFIYGGLGDRGVCEGVDIRTICESPHHFR